MIWADGRLLAEQKYEEVREEEDPFALKYGSVSAVQMPEIPDAWDVVETSVSCSQPISCVRQKRFDSPYVPGEGRPIKLHR